MSSLIHSGVGPVDSDFGFERPRRARTQFRRPQTARTVRPMADVDDGELMVRYAGGDLRAFETLYRRHRSALYRYLARHTRDPEIANDLFQEVWSKVIASPHVTSRGRNSARSCTGSRTTVSSITA